MDNYLHHSVQNLLQSLKQHGVLSTSVLKNSSFVAEGFGNWNKALERFEMHEKSEVHREALEKLQSNIHIGNLCNKEVTADQEFYRCMLFFSSYYEPLDF